MNHQPLAISTRQASALLNVHESSIKRWCNANQLEFWLTKGGHRRIPIDTLIAFASRQGIVTPLAHFGENAGRVWEGIQQATQADNFHDLAQLMYSWIANGDHSRPTHLLGYMKSEGIALAALLDGLIGPVMQRIGIAYEGGELSVGDEHRMTQVMRDVLVSMSVKDAAMTPQNGRHRPTAIVGCARNEMHELGALMVRLMLEAAGWDVIYLGQNVPTEDFATMQFQSGASLVCISIMPPMGKSEAQSIIMLLDRMYESSKPYRLAIGGTAFSKRDELNTLGVNLDVSVFNQMTAFERWLKETASH